MGFEVGNKVQMKEDITGTDTLGIDKGTISEYKGKVFTVSDLDDRVREDEVKCMSLEEDKWTFNWNSELFELVSETEDTPCEN